MDTPTHPNEFEVYCYYLGQETNELTHRFKEQADKFYQFSKDVNQICNQIIADNIHILVFPHIGIDPITTQIASLRLAPFQCTSWCHPVTTGLSTIDYFLSSECMEPANGQEHYTEQLILLPNIAVSYPKPDIPERSLSREAFDIPNNAIVYLSCQNPKKYLPQYDAIFANIAQKVRRAKFIFLSHSCNHRIMSVFKQRMQRSFMERGLCYDDFCIVLPWLDEYTYLQLNLVSDIYLDTIGWSGGFTTLKAIACCLPVITYPYHLMRGRHSYGILKMLGVIDTIAKDEQDYVNIAIKLGLDPTLRNKIANQIARNHHYLFDDTECIQGLEDFYKTLIRDSNFVVVKDVE